MKNLKKPARLPRKAPSNQTGGTAWGKKLAAEISRMAQSADMKKLILLNFPYIIAFYMVEKAAWLYRHCNGDSVVDRLMVLFMNFGLAYKSVLPSFHPFDLMVGLVGAAALKAVIYFKGKNAKKYRQGEEYGSARWGNQKDIEPFIDPVFENNVILTQTERLMMSGRPKHPKYARNKNVIVIGGSGSGKSAYAEQCILDFGGTRRVYIATMQPFGAEGQARIARHRKMRAAKKFSTIECYTNLKEVELEPGSDVLLECMSNLTANEIFDPSGAGKARTEEEILAGVSRLAHQARNLVLVTNEIFSDGYRYEEETMEYQRILGNINVRLAEMADCVTEVVYGIPVRIKKE